MKKVVKSLMNFSVVNFETDPLGNKYVEIYYKRKRIGNLLKMNVKRILKRSVVKKIKVPKGMRVVKIQNNTPKVGEVTITYIKNKK